MTTTRVDDLVGQHTYTVPGGSPDTARELWGRELTVSLKRALGVRFPNITFRVAGSRGTGTGWYRVGWTDGPTAAEVNAVTARYEAQRFDGMDDSYHDTGEAAWVERGEWVRGTARGVTPSRTLSRGSVVLLVRRVADFFGVMAPEVSPSGHVEGTLHGEYWSTWVHRAAARPDDFRRDA